MPNDYLTPPEASAYLRVPSNTLRNWRSQGRGPRYRKLGGKVTYRRDWLDDYSDRHVIEPSEAAP
jgi:excisionase family DNA binding protein